MRRPLLIALAVGLLVVVGAVVVASVLVAQAVARDEALAQHRAAAAELRSALADTRAVLGEADEVLALAGDPLTPEPEVAALGDRAAAAEAVAGRAGDALASDPEALGTDEVRDEANDLRGIAADLDADRADLSAALDGVLGAVAAAAPSVEAAAFDANNAPHVAFRGAAVALADPADDLVGETLADYLEAARALEASHAAELAEKAGPLFDARMAVQEFARSLAGGVLLEFDWAPLVNGYGSGGSYGGTSYWTTAEGGQATVTLTDSVARQWPGAGVQALVVHEVGHAILSRRDCNRLYFESELYPGEEESWATAWAIGLGYTADGSGESVYGRPSDALIALSQQCR